MFSERQKQSIRYWRHLCAYMRQHGSQLRLPRPSASHYRDFGIGVPRCCVRAVQRIRPVSIIVAFVMTGDAKTYFDSLKEQQAEIETEFGEPLVWFAEWEIESQIYLIRDDMNPADEQDWCHQYEWITSKLEKLNEVFRPRIDRLRDEMT